MYRRITMSLGVFALATLTACTAPAEDTDATTPAPNPPVTSEEQPDTDAFVAELKEIDPALAADAEDAVTAAKNVCSYVAAGEDEAQLLKAVKDRFEGVSDADAEKVLAAAKEHIC